MKLPACLTWILASCVVGAVAKSGSLQSRRHHHHHLASSPPTAGRTNVFIPSRAHLRSVPVGNTGVNASVYWTYRPQNVLATTAYIIVHGRLRNGGQYWDLMEDTLLGSAQAGKADPSSIVAAPQFWAADLDQGKYLPNELAWLPNGWSGGGDAVHPANVQISSIDVLDTLIDLFHNATHYPSITNIVAVGHGGGAQLLQRHALVGKDSTLPLKYVIANPSSNAYPSADRPASDSELSACPTYNNWRYGLENYNGTSSSTLTSPTDLFTRYVQRDVINVIAMNDTSPGGDQSCSAVVQGGVARRDRGLAFWKYLNMLARTSEDVSSLPGNFSTALPDWSVYAPGGLKHHLVIVPNTNHNPEKVFRSPQGRAALFAKSEVDILSGYYPASSSSSVTSSSTSTSGTSSSTSSAGAQTTSTDSASSTSSASSTTSSIGSTSTGGSVPSEVQKILPHKGREKGKRSRRDRRTSQQ